MAIATGDSVTLEYTGRLDDGTVFDTSIESVAEETGLADAQPDREYSPLTVEMGEGQIIPGLEEALSGLTESETRTVTVPPEKGYGEWTDEHVQEFDTEELRQALGDEQLAEGAYLQAQNGDHGEIVDVGDETVRVDFNPELAGETLEFEIQIVDVN
ncbi:peptidylprolyl isomerase [Haloplanus sp. GCM10025708]|uniref:FKBP-type peptidyl-prolyl cis-trans isomerase n=1 Tax=Haloferacaceae TaxID=1644056 RepID=UPI0036148FFB